MSTKMKNLPRLKDLASLPLINAKMFLLCSCLVCSASAGERNLTGNAFWDLQMAVSDTVSAVQSVVVNRPSEAKSPMLNGLFSLVIPGAGQYNSERYTKAAIFIAVEAALITYAVINNRNGNKKTEEFQRYADAHWSAERYARWIENWGVTDYGPNLTAPMDYSKIANHDFSQIREWEQGPHDPNGFSHQLPSYGEQQYYELIGKYNQYKFGWDEYEVDGVRAADANGIPPSDHSTPGNSQYDKYIPQQMLDYAVERGKANDYYYAAGFAMSALVVNHIISAIDAFISTRSYNKEISATVGVKPIDSYEGKRLMSELRISVGF